jgi:hypothetical protein
LAFSWEKHMDYLEKQRKKTMEAEERRREAWKNPKCQEIYHRIIEFCGGNDVVRSGMKGQIKQHAITCFLKGKEPDFKKFYHRVTVANMINEKRMKSN